MKEVRRKSDSHPTDVWYDTPSLLLKLVSNVFCISTKRKGFQPPLNVCVSVNSRNRNLAVRYLDLSKYMCVCVWLDVMYGSVRCRN